MNQIVILIAAVSFVVTVPSNRALSASPCYPGLGDCTEADKPATAPLPTPSPPEQLTQQCTFSGTWLNEHGTSVKITQAGAAIRGTFTQAASAFNRGGIVDFGGSATGTELKAIFQPTDTPETMYRKGGAISFTLANCIRINGWMSNSIGQFQGEPGGAIHSNLSLRRSDITPP